MHIGFIMDGNRRWAKKRMLPSSEGHRKGYQKLKQVLNFCDADEVTVYALSTENLKRSKKEVNHLFNLFRKAFSELEKEDVKVNFIGNLSLLPEDIQEQIKNLKKEGKKILNLCVAYGGRDEIVNAVNKALENGKKVTEESFKELLYLKTDPDLIIRTGGKKRTSNFLPYQSVYSEWFFTETLWPAFSEEEYSQILKEFHKRKRNFGK